MTYLPLTSKDRELMIKEIGVESFNELISVIPKSLRNPQIKLPLPLSEYELVKHATAKAQKNTTTNSVLSFVGAGAYEHFIPSIVNHIVSRSEFYTAYTPYQAEASQGTLQAIYEYQTMICRLTGLDVANASHYDGATSMAEAALLAANVKGRKKIVVARTVHPEYRSVLKTYVKGTELEVLEVEYDSNGYIDIAQLEELLTKDVACFIAQTPNFFGVVENFSDVEVAVHKQRALFILAANPMSLACFKSPGEWNADIACGEGQVFGGPLSFGGPYLGYFAVKKEYMRKMPGRIAGLTTDTRGRRAFTLTLQAREQHIRRARASSNICSNQSLCALAAVAYLAAVGNEGLREIAYLNIKNASYLRDKLKKNNQCEIVFGGPIFNEFVIRINNETSKIRELLLEEGIAAGVSLDEWYPELNNTLLVCATEIKSKEDLDRFARSVEKIVEKIEV